ncbi:TIGR04283 family arsenosugar biosynthesis glycosyltransferase [Simiduia curdlanivorans]|uniref:TIGR04283 family arsenosugar biosynthesis glycosyltransferase n=1 Tax=Simiduia curdlanivorans TaxID=1492769 RepID=A0ABV8V826_9GAMM|nr:TIGR04283 family arsenosugar biosynthesis glycosyltransferase [Simiduia curdlanivorans]MDN3639615.1 TIGR04283 family arsenosugar biosynthesis glycosyltransferase [Simiduia curdlanivorans]
MAARSINPISIIIPTYGDIEQVAVLLRSLQPLRAQGAELLVANGCAEDANKAAELAWLADHIVNSQPGRARQMNTAAAIARGEFLLFLHADSRVTASLFEPFFSPQSIDSSWGFYRLRIEPADGLLPLVAKLINIRSGLTHIATGDQALWVRRDLFDALGGYPDQALMEDIELCARLGKNYKPTHFSGFVITSSRRWQSKGQIRTIVTMWWLRLRYWLGANPNHLAAIYYPHLKQTDC